MTFLQCLKIKTMKKACMFILLTITVFYLQGSHSQVSVQTEPEKFKVAVLVSKSNDDTQSQKSLNNLIKSYIKRELRSLGDVEIVDRDLDRATFQYVMAISMVEATYKDGSKTGLVAMSVLLLERIPPNRFNDLWRERYTKFPAFLYPLSGVITVGWTELDEECKSIVADFDTTFLEPERLFR